MQSWLPTLNSRYVHLPWTNLGADHSESLKGSGAHESHRQQTLQDSRMIRLETGTSPWRVSHGAKDFKGKIWGEKVDRAATYATPSSHTNHFWLTLPRESLRWSAFPWIPRAVSAALMAEYRSSMASMWCRSPSHGIPPQEVGWSERGMWHMTNMTNVTKHKTNLRSNRHGSQIPSPRSISCVFFFSEKSGLESVSSLHTSRLYLVLLEPETSVDKWLFQLDDSKSLHGKWLFKQTSRHPFKTGGSGFQEGIISQFHQISSNILKCSLLYSMCISVKVVYMHSFTIQISPISIDLSCRYSFESTLAQKHPVTVLREWKWLLEETSTHSVPWMQRTRLKQPGSDHPIVQPIY